LPSALVLLVQPPPRLAELPFARLFRLAPCGVGVRLVGRARLVAAMLEPAHFLQLGAGAGLPCVPADPVVGPSWFCARCRRRPIAACSSPLLLWLSALADLHLSRGSALTSAGSAWLARASGGRPAASSSRPVKGGVPVQARETLAPDKGQVSSGDPPSLPQIGRSERLLDPRHTPAWDDEQAPGLPWPSLLEFVRRDSPARWYLATASASKR
jgi:hypothetical protein